MISGFDGINPRWLLALVAVFMSFMTLMVIGLLSFLPVRKRLVSWEYGKVFWLMVFLFFVHLAWAVPVFLLLIPFKKVIYISLFIQIVFYLPVVLFVFKRYPREELGLIRPSPRFFLIPVLIVLIGGGCYYLLWEHFKPYSFQGIFSSNLFEIFLIFISAVILSPLVEEVFFRALLLQSLEERTGTLVAVLFSSLVYLIWHLPSFNVYGRLFLGIILGVLFASSRSLIPSVIFHALWNLVVVCFYVRIP